MISDIYLKFPNEKLIYNFIENNLYFIDIDKDMIDNTKNNIKLLYKYLFNDDFLGNFKSIISDFSINTLEIFVDLYDNFDYIIGNPPYVSLYGRRDKKTK